MGHVTGKGLTGWTQFLRSWRNQYLRFHRYLGYFYVTAVFTSSISGLIIALFSTGGIIGGFGFGILAILWFITNLFAVTNIKKGKVKEHEKWMIRNYGLTFSAVTLRIYLPIILLIGSDIAQALQIVSFLCWVPNIVATELLFALSCIGIGLYPLSYFSPSFRHTSVLSTLANKIRELNMNHVYLIAFYTHISFGGFALLTGWTQFIRSWRKKHLQFHRYIGRLHVLAVSISSIAAFIMSFFATGGVIAGVGFGILAVLWFTSTLVAFVNIRKKNIKEHQKWMMRSYSLAFSAVTLRVYLPILRGNGVELEPVLRIVSFLCWIPNVIVMEMNIKMKHSEGVTQALKSKLRESDGQ